MLKHHYVGKRKEKQQENIVFLSHYSWFIYLKMFCHKNNSQGLWKEKEKENFVNS